MFCLRTCFPSSAQMVSLTLILKYLTGLHQSAKYVAEPTPKSPGITVGKKIWMWNQRTVAEMSAQVWSIGSEKCNFPRGLGKGLTQMPSKYNLDVNIVNYLIAHKSTIGADSAMNDISFLRQSWGEGDLLWKISQFVLPLYPCYQPAGGSCPSIPAGRPFPQNTLESPSIHPLLQGKGPRAWKAQAYTCAQAEHLHHWLRAASRAAGMACKSFPGGKSAKEKHQNLPSSDNFFSFLLLVMEKTKNVNNMLLYYV